MARPDDLDRFYRLLDDLERRVDGTRKLKNCDGRMDWPERAVYFFLEPGETRESSNQLRVTRVGTHAVSEKANRSLWDRLKEHYGTGSGSKNYPHGGSHRASVYRKAVGGAFIEKHDLHDDYPDWDRPWRKIDRERSVVKEEEYVLQRRVSAYIREQPFLWAEVDDEPSADSDRKFVERNAIAILQLRPPADRPTGRLLARSVQSERDDPELRALEWEPRRRAVRRWISRPSRGRYRRNDLALTLQNWIAPFSSSPHPYSRSNAGCLNSAAPQPRHSV